MRVFTLANEQEGPDLSRHRQPALSRASRQSLASRPPFTGLPWRQDSPRVLIDGASHTAYKPRAGAQLEGSARGTEATVKFSAESLASGLIKRSCVGTRRRQAGGERCPKLVKVLPASADEESAGFNLVGLPGGW
jgi:hypothetical protein